MSNSKGIPYYFNAITKQSSWDAPSELSEEQIRSLPGANYLSSRNSGGAGTITASHLLVKHKDSRRPSSWKEVCVCLPSRKARRDVLFSSRRKSRAPRMRPRKFSEDIRPNSGTRARSSKNWRVSIPIARRTRRRAILVRFQRARCRSRLRMLHSLCRSESSAISSAQTVVCTSF